MMDPRAIEQAIRSAIPGADVRCIDLQGGDHFEVEVVAEAFEGRSILEQHRMVYGALGDAMSGPIHALAIRTLTPAAARRLSEPACG